MIWITIIGAFGGLLNAVFSALNLPKVTTLPFVDGYLSTGVGYMYFMFHFFPPLGIIFQGFLLVLGWKVILIMVRMIPFIGRAVKNP